MTLADIELDIFRRLDYADAPPPSVKSRVDSFINQRHKQIVSHDRMRSLRFGRTSFVSVENQSAYAVGGGIRNMRITRVVNRDGKYELAARTVEWWREHNPDPSSNGGGSGGEVWVPLGEQFPFGQSLSDTAGHFSATSTSAESTTVFSLIAKTVDGSETATITIPTAGLAVPFDFVANVLAFTSFTSNKPARGIVTVNSPLLVPSLIQINVGAISALRPMLAISPAPGGGITYDVDFERQILDLTGPTDTPLLPEDFHDLLCMYGRLDEYEYKSDNRWQALMMQVQARLKELRAFVDNHDVYKQHAVPESVSRSRLGPWFPAGA